LLPPSTSSLVLQHLDSGFDHPFGEYETPGNCHNFTLKTDIASLALLFPQNASKFSSRVN
jgi:hypothetical protein